MLNNFRHIHKTERAICKREMFGNAASYVYGNTGFTRALLRQLDVCLVYLYADCPRSLCGGFNQKTSLSTTKVKYHPAS